MHVRVTVLLPAGDQHGERRDCLLALLAGHRLGADPFDRGTRPPLDAERYHTVYGSYGISVFAVRDVTLDELAQQVPLIRFGWLTLIKVADVYKAGLRLEPTGRNPRHCTVGFDDLAQGVARLAGCEHQQMPNPYHDA